LFSIDGYIFRVHDRDDAEFGFYVFDDEGSSILPGKEITITYPFDGDYGLSSDLTDLTLIDVQPFLDDEERVTCDYHSLQKVDC
jgi:hypothetical protein